MERSDSEVVELDGHRLTLTNLDKVLYPETGTTKADVIRYYDAVADAMIPHVRDRIATRKRWVHGVGTPEHPGQVFFQKNLDPASTPSWVKQSTITHKTSTNAYPLVNDRATLVWLAQIASLEIHVPQWRVGRGGARRNPDRLVLDLDPGEGATLLECAEVARLAKAILEGMGLDPMPVTSGSKGIHLYAPLDGKQTADQVSAVAHELARALEADHPDLVVSDMKKSLRAGKVLVDWSQNNGAKTTVAPYSLRGRFRPTVAAPRTWRELASEDLAHLEYTEVLARLKRRGDPLADLDAGRLDAGRLEVGRLEVGRTGPITGTPISPMLATLGSEKDVDDESEWAFEMKWDGIRAIAEARRGALRLSTRNGNDVTGTYPDLAGLSDLAGDHDLVLDGEIVTLDPSGRPDFGLLQTRMGLTRAGDVAAAVKRAPVHYLAFDILERDGEDLTTKTYDERRAILASALRPPKTDPVQVPPAFDGDLRHAVDASRELGLEGVMAKQRDGRYAAGRRSRTWIKIKHHRMLEVVVAGWRPGNGRRANTIGALLLGIPEDGALRYVGKVGTGFTDDMLDDLAARLAAHPRKTSPLTDVPSADARDARWVRPELVGEVEFAEWTVTRRLRQPSWRGLRLDKSVDDINLEELGSADSRRADPRG
jgi:bifunctional non-homologous end joining protein LigD